MVHEKANGIAIFSAAKAVKKLLGGADCETGRFFAMKGTKPHEICATFFQLDEAANDLHHIYAGYKFLNKRLRNGHTCIFAQVRAFNNLTSINIQGVYAKAA
jgi:hypothetical protein